MLTWVAADNHQGVMQSFCLITRLTGLWEWCENSQLKCEDAVTFLKPFSNFDWSDSGPVKQVWSTRKGGGGVCLMVFGLAGAKRLISDWLTCTWHLRNKLRILNECLLWFVGWVCMWLSIQGSRCVIHSVSSCCVCNKVKKKKALTHPEGLWEKN